MRPLKQHPELPSGFNETFPKRFWRNVDKKSEDECWEWKGAYLGFYGRTYPGATGHTMRAHRASFVLHTKSEIPDGLCVLHNCDNPKCVNPIHLRLGTMADNCDDRDSRGRHFMQTKPESHVNGERTGTAKLYPDDVVFIRKNKDLKNTELSAWFGVGATQISRIKRGERWAHLPL